MWHFLSVISTSLWVRTLRCPNCGARQFQGNRDAFGRIVCWRCKRTFTPQGYRHGVGSR